MTAAVPEASDDGGKWIDRVLSWEVDADRDAIARLAALPGFEYERVREEEARLLRVRVSALDAEVSRLRARLSAGGEDRPPAFSDDAIAAEFWMRCGQDLRYVAAWGKWLRWDGSRWSEDRTVRVFDQVREVCRSVASKCPDEKLRRAIASAKTIAPVERIARSNQALAVVPEALDADPMLLNTPGGTVDMRSAELRPHHRADLLTRMTAVTPDFVGLAPMFSRFVRDVTCDRAELGGFLQRFFGYAATGDTRDHALLFCYGRGANGKSTLLDLVRDVMGDYARVIPAETLMEARGERHPTEIANLMNIRLAISNELEEGQHWAESRLKKLTGDAMLSGRFMRQDLFEFRRTHKHVIAGNHKPVIRVVDDALRRRIHLVPFNAQFAGESADRDMPAKLRAERPAVLAWIIRGCQEWLLAGLSPSEEVQVATRDYLATQDLLAQWVDERCMCGDPTGRTRSGTLYADFKAWKEARGERPVSHMRFSMQLEGRFAKHHDSDNYPAFAGISLKSLSSEASETSPI